MRRAYRLSNGLSVANDVEFFPEQAPAATTADSIIHFTRCCVFLSAQNSASSEAFSTLWFPVLCCSTSRKKKKRTERISHRWWITISTVLSSGIYTHFKVWKYSLICSLVSCSILFVSLIAEDYELCCRVTIDRVYVASFWSSWLTLCINTHLLTLFIFSIWQTFTSMLKIFAHVPSEVHAHVQLHVNGVNNIFSNQFGISVRLTWSHFMFSTHLVPIYLKIML